MPWLVTKRVAERSDSGDDAFRDHGGWDSLSHWLVIALHLRMAFGTGERIVDQMPMHISRSIFQPDSGLHMALIKYGFRGGVPVYLAWYPSHSLAA